MSQAYPAAAAAAPATRSGRDAFQDEFDARFGVSIKIVVQHEFVQTKAGGPNIGFRTGKQPEGEVIGKKRLSSSGSRA
jgi:hypothetical protein